MQRPLRIFSCNSNPLLAHNVCVNMGVAPGRALVARFSDGEVRLEVHDNVRGMDAYVIQSTCPPVNDTLFELLLMIDALKRASAWRVNAVIPYYGYGRQDQKIKPRVAISAKVVADLLVTAGAQRIISVDLHAEQIEGFFTIPVDHLSGMEVLLEDAKKHLRGDEVVIAPDAGGVPRARSFAKRLRVGLAIIDHRDKESRPYSRIVGEIKGRRVIILDDMVDSGRTLVRAAQAAQLADADVIDAYCVHPVLSHEAWKLIETSPVRYLTVTDTIPLCESATGSARIRTVSVAPLLAEAIRRIHREESVSSLFGN
jgi:ribose-phosphate pyrophosphokinase